MNTDANIKSDSLNNILNSLILYGQKESDTITGISEYLLDIAINLTGSKTGFAALFDKDSNVSNLFHYPKSFNFFINNPAVTYDEITKILSELFYQHKPLILNQDVPESLNLVNNVAEKKEIKRHLSVPVIENDKIVLIIGVNNKEEDYSDYDTNIVSLLGMVSWHQINRLMAERSYRAKDVVAISL